MNLCVIFMIFTLCAGYLWCSRINSAIDQTTDEKFILAKIISNFVKKYFSNDKVYVSVIISPHQKEPNAFGNDFLYSLLDSLTMVGFAYNVFDKLGNTRNTRDPFYLILIDDYRALK